MVLPFTVGFGNISQKPSFGASLNQSVLSENKSNNPGGSIKIYLNRLKEKIDTLEAELILKDREIETLKTAKLRANDEVFDTIEDIDAETPVGAE